MRKTVCLDLDGVLAQYDGWKGVDHIGEPIPRAVSFTEDIAQLADIVIHTTRCNPEVHKPTSPRLLRHLVEDWLKLHGFVFHDIYTGIGKPIAAAYVDDRAIICRPQITPHAYAGALAEIAHLLGTEQVEKNVDD